MASHALGEMGLRTDYAPACHSNPSVHSGVAASKISDPYNNYVNGGANASSLLSGGFWNPAPAASCTQYALKAEFSSSVTLNQVSRGVDLQLHCGRFRWRKASGRTATALSSPADALEHTGHSDRGPWRSGPRAHRWSLSLMGSIGLASE